MPKISNSIRYKIQEWIFLANKNTKVLSTHGKIVCFHPRGKRTVCERKTPIFVFQNIKLFFFFFTIITIRIPLEYNCIQKKIKNYNSINNNENT